ncbi:Rha family transcriptional regulator [Sphingobium sp. RAC03]|uniref:Rha family transcriptional regulator n=1 Tax=Sphingobium sp. RAC03 TaxID=1843368 RepID=UPI00083D410C|nr:Rha family transcriptional regulator [Sphingobium sp. RAC03]AOF97692.1 phage regulatory Rha family protein [Sphingobium sp. RAC03]
MPDTATLPTIWLDSRELAQRFGRRHHNLLKSIDQLLAQCPAAADHVKYSTYPAIAGLGGTRHVRHALVDRIGFTLLAITLGTTQRDIVFDLLMAFEATANPN